VAGLFKQLRVGGECHHGRTHRQWLTATIGNDTSISGNFCRSNSTHVALMLEKSNASVLIYPLQ
jgi:hypothetical protein